MKTAELAARKTQDQNGVEVVRRPLADLIPYARNTKRHSSAQIDALAASLAEFGWTKPVLTDGDNGIVAGHGIVMAAKRLADQGHAIPNWPDNGTAPVIELSHLTEYQRRAYVIADNRLAELAEWDTEMLQVELEDLASAGFDTSLTGWSLDALLHDAASGEEEDDLPGLEARFLAVPFTVLSAREGWWQDRKRKWIAAGINSEEGRDDNLLFDTNKDTFGGQIMDKLGQTSIFDPVLCELLYRWFSPLGGTVLDPFAGGSVRGIVAAQLGRAYTGVDLRPEQVEANRDQWATIEDEPFAMLHGAALPPDSTPEVTPIERRGQFWLKRDDLFCIGGVRGGKVRTCYTLAQGATGLVTAGSRQSPQANIVAHIAKHLGVPARVHTPEGELSPELQAAQGAGAEVAQHKAGYNSVIIARAKADAKKTGWREIPFGMECPEAVEATAKQVQDIPEGVQRIVMPVGSGMSLAGVLTGLQAAGIYDLPVLGVQVGADPTDRLDKYAPPDWRDRVTIVQSPHDYHEHAPITHLEGVELDPVYEAKCLRFLQPGDLLWVVGLRQSRDRSVRPEHRPPIPEPQWICGDSQNVATLAEGTQADFVFSCPPYADLEVYSDDPADLSNMDYPEFMTAYRRIIKEAVAMLKPDRFAAFVVGEIRDQRGIYRGFVRDTIDAFVDAGAPLYNEAILVTQAGSLPIRTGRTFSATRKLGKTHQNVLIFVKGDPRRATEACGDPLIPDLVFPPAAQEEATCPACHTKFHLPLIAPPRLERDE